MAIGPIALFALVSAWSEKRILFHWAGPGYLMLFPLAGAVLARFDLQKARWPRIGAAATAAFVVVLVAVAASEVRFGWLPQAIEDALGPNDPDLDAVDWSSLRDDLTSEGHLDRGDLFIAATHWTIAGKLDYGLGGAMPVVCLCSDAREYGIVRPQRAQFGRDALILDPRMTLSQMQAAYRDRFERIEELPPFYVLHAGEPKLPLNVFLGSGFRPAVPERLGTIRP
jgi:hypothetical protein